MTDQPRELSYLIMQAVLDLIKRDIAGLSQDDPSRLRLVEMRPRSEGFADMVLSCSISPNDPDEPGAWEDIEIQKWPQKQDPFGQNYGRNFNEIGGGQGFEYRYTITFRMYYNELGIDKDVAIKSARIILARIRKAIVQDHRQDRKLMGLKDDFGSMVVSTDKAVKAMEAIPSGSDDEVIIKGKMKLSFGTYMEPQ